MARAKTRLGGTFQYDFRTWGYDPKDFLDAFVGRDGERQRRCPIESHAHSGSRKPLCAQF